ncbi:hypothetical protein [uncultured Sulfitobacter sp.]|uniref:hypothetical protein n=1 Tax=uncultured Sulfitobacter sp. TaxID=191468 RepID=UPI00262081A5|nr:hypothetical protein [uncultured Sulfitobacter sp.]
MAASFVSGSTAAEDQSRIIPNTLVACLSTTETTSFSALRDTLISSGWRYPTTVEEKALYWNYSFGREVGPLSVIHKDTAFPGIHLTVDRAITVSAVYEKGLSDRYDVAICSLHLSDPNDFNAAVKFLNALGPIAGQDDTSITFDFGKTSATGRHSRTREIAPFSIETIANFPAKETQ